MTCDLRVNRVITLALHYAENGKAVTGPAKRWGYFSQESVFKKAGFEVYCINEFSCILLGGG